MVIENTKIQQKITKLTTVITRQEIKKDIGDHILYGIRTDGDNSNCQCVIYELSRKC